MRIAVLFYGYARTIGQLIKEYNLSLPPTADIFIQTYNTFYAEPQKDPVYNTSNITYTSRDYFDKIFKNKIRGFDITQYDPSFYKDIIKQNEIPETNFARQHTHRVFAMFNNIKKVVQMKTEYENLNKFKYDAVILTRLDLCFNSPIIIPSDLNKLSYPMGEGYFPNHKRKYGAAKVFGSDRFLNDQILIAKSSIIDQIGTIYNNIVKYNKEFKIEINPETLVGWFCIKNNIKFSEENICSYIIFR